MTQSIEPIEEDNSELLKSIVQIRGAMEKLMKSGLNKKAIIVLVQDRLKLPKKDIENVMDTLYNLEKWYTNHNNHRFESCLFHNKTGL